MDDGIHPDKEYFIKRIKEMGVTYTELADKIQVSRNTITNFLHGHHKPSLHLIVSLAKELKLNNLSFVKCFFPEFYEE